MLPKGYVPLSLDLFADYDSYLRKSARITADVSFANLWGWAEHYGIGISFRRDLCWICQTKPELRIWGPVGDWENARWENEPELQGALRLVRVPGELKDILLARLGSRTVSEEDRDQWEYLYDRDELALLPGAKFHKKKNHVNAFHKAYGEDYRMIGDERYPNVVEDILRLQEEWCQWKDCENSPSLRAENEAIFRVIGSMDKIPGLCGGALYVGGSIGAFSVGEKIGDMMIVHFEKARTELRGGYQAINHSFANHSAQGVRWLNREQDMGELGLRQAKETYHPAGFLKKFRLVIEA